MVTKKQLVLILILYMINRKISLGKKNNDYTKHEAQPPVQSLALADTVVQVQNNQIVHDKHFEMPRLWIRFVIIMKSFFSRHS